jgi:eukaryotic-like serine/threonine-protein kinase
VSDLLPATDDSLPLSVGRRLDAVCLRFEAAWQAGRPPRIEALLDGVPPDERPALLRELVALDLAYRRRGGEAPTPDEYRPRFPDQETLLREVFDRADGLPSTGAEGAAPPAAPPPAPAGPPRYTALRLQARGGLGEVHVARDAELHRTVALKRMRRHLAGDADSRRRFLVEAEITGRLEHPGIEPVYAMRFVEGETLKEAADRYHAALLPSPPLRGRGAGGEGNRRLAFRQLLTHFVAACNAVAYAHSRGVIHRDLKPSNILLGKFGETLVVDWGLAKVVGRSEPGQADREGRYTAALEGDGEATAVGQAIGTPSFMSPEQAAGRWDVVGPASDVYSLGATLYSLLTGQAPFHGQDNVEILAQVQRGSLTPPRQVNAGVPRALEAICLKAMALERHQRYAPAQALAADVEHWLADEPVAAYAEPWAARARRWMQRHRVLVTGAAAALVVLAISLALGAGLLGAVNAQLRQRAIDLANEQARTQEALQAEAERRKEAREALDAQTSLVMEDLLGRQAVLTEEHKQFLRQALQAYERFAASTGQEEESRAGVARAYWRVGSIRHRLGIAAEAEKAYRQAVTFYEQLSRDFPTVPDYRRELAATQSNLGLLRQERRQLATAQAAFEQALTVRQQLAQEFPTVPGYRKDLAAGYNSLGRLLRDQGKPEAAKAAYEQALAVQRQLTRDFPTLPEYRWELARTYNNWANLLYDQKAWKAAQAAYEENLAVQRQLVQDFPTKPTYRRELGNTHYNLGLVLMEQREWAAAEAAYERALAVRKPLAQDFPAVPDYRQDLGVSYHMLGLLLEHQAKKAAAQAAYEQAVAVRRPLAQDFPTIPAYGWQLAGSHNNLGNVLYEQGNWKAAARLTNRPWPCASGWPRTSPPNRSTVEEWLSATAAWAMRGGAWASARRRGRRTSKRWPSASSWFRTPPPDARGPHGVGRQLSQPRPPGTGRGLLGGGPGLVRPGHRRPGAGIGQGAPPARRPTRSPRRPQGTGPGAGPAGAPRRGGPGLGSGPRTQ